MSAQTTHFADDATLSRISQLERENRELAAALTMMLSYVDERDFDGAPSDYAVSIARAALAKVQP